MFHYIFHVFLLIFCISVTFSCSNTKNLKIVFTVATSFHIFTYFQFLYSVRCFTAFSMFFLNLLYLCNIFLLKHKEFEDNFHFSNISSYFHIFPVNISSYFYIFPGNISSYFHTFPVSVLLKMFHRIVLVFVLIFLHLCNIFLLEHKEIKHSFHFSNNSSYFHTFPVSVLRKMFHCIFHVFLLILCIFVTFSC